MKINLIVIVSDDFEGKFSNRREKEVKWAEKINGKRQIDGEKKIIFESDFWKAQQWIDEGL